MIAQLFGYIALLIYILMFWQKDRKWILIFSFLESVLYGIHYCLLEGVTGGLIDIILAFMSLIYLQKNKGKIPFEKYLPLFFGLLFIFICIFTYHGIESIIILIAGIIAAICDFSDHEKVIRIGALIAQILWLVYSIVLHSIPGMIGDTCVLISAILAVIHIDILKKDPNEKVL